MELSAWASELAERTLAATVPRRWGHVQGVARRARTLRSVAGADADLLEAAAFLHDIGYAPELASTGFHPLDGAVYLRELGAPTRLVDLVAHHSCAVVEARLRGLVDELGRFEDDRSVVRDALWYCDLTTSPDGDSVAARARLAEITQRYGADHVVARFVTEAADELLAAVGRTEVRLAWVRAGS
jgi:putative nucleotidyltransferase with HDIG domain